MYFEVCERKLRQCAPKRPLTFWLSTCGNSVREDCCFWDNTVSNLWRSLTHNWMAAWMATWSAHSLKHTHTHTKNPRDEDTIQHEGVSDDGDADEEVLRKSKSESCTNTHTESCSSNRTTNTQTCEHGASVCVWMWCFVCGGGACGCIVAAYVWIFTRALHLPETKNTMRNRVRVYRLYECYEILPSRTDGNNIVIYCVHEHIGITPLPRLPLLVCGCAELRNSRQVLRLCKKKTSVPNATWPLQSMAVIGSVGGFFFVQCVNDYCGLDCCGIVAVAFFSIINACHFYNEMCIFSKTFTALLSHNSLWLPGFRITKSATHFICATHQIHHLLHHTP